MKFHAASLNYRDVLFGKGFYNPNAKFPAIPLSDGSGEVVAIGENVTQWKIGDRVCPIFMQNWLEGGPSWQKGRSAIGGGDLDDAPVQVGAGGVHRDRPPVWIRWLAMETPIQPCVVRGS